MRVYFLLYIWRVYKSFKGVGMLLFCVFLLLVFISGYRLIEQLAM